MSTFDLKIAAGAKGCLVDTSIWVEVLRSRDRRTDHPVIPVITEFTETDFIYTSQLIVAEVIAGARDQREAEGLELDFGGYRFPSEDLGLFRHAAYTRQAYVRAFRRSPAPGLIDCYLACLAKREGLIIFTADKPLRAASDFRGIKGIFFSIDGKTLSHID